MNRRAFSLLMRHAFAYLSRGYRDWVSYADEVHFKQALLLYMNPANHAQIQANGVDMERLVYGMLGQVGACGYVEKGK